MGSLSHRPDPMEMTPRPFVVALLLAGCPSSATSRSTPVASSSDGDVPESSTVTAASDAAPLSQPSPRSMPGYMAIGTLPAYETTVAGRPIVIEFDESWAHDAFVTHMRAGDQIVYPPPCASPPALPARCSKAYRERGGHEFLAVKLVSQNVAAERADFLFAAVYEGAGDCGAYGYWLVRVESPRVCATPPARGCFAGHGDHETTVASKSRPFDGSSLPRSRWTRRRARRGDRRERRDEGTFTWARASSWR